MGRLNKLLPPLVIRVQLREEQGDNERQVDKRLETGPACDAATQAGQERQEVAGRDIGKNQVVVILLAWNKL